MESNSNSTSSSTYRFSINPDSLQYLKKDEDGNDRINVKDPIRPIFDFLLDNPNLTLFLIFTHILVAYLTSSTIFTKCKKAANQCAEFFEANVDINKVKKK